MEALHAVSQTGGRKRKWLPDTGTCAHLTSSPPPTTSLPRAPSPVPCQPVPQQLLGWYCQGALAVDPVQIPLTTTCLAQALSGSGHTIHLLLPPPSPAPYQPLPHQQLSLSLPALSHSPHRPGDRPGLRVPPAHPPPTPPPSHIGHTHQFHVCQCHISKTLDNSVDGVVLHQCGAASALPDTTLLRLLLLLLPLLQLLLISCPFLCW